MHRFQSLLKLRISAFSSPETQSHSAKKEPSICLPRREKLLINLKMRGLVPKPHIKRLLIFQNKKTLLDKEEKCQQSNSLFKLTTIQISNDSSKSNIKIQTKLAINSYLNKIRGWSNRNQNRIYVTVRNNALLWHEKLGHSNLNASERTSEVTPLHFPNILLNIEDSDKFLTCSTKQLSLPKRYYHRSLSVDELLIAIQKQVIGTRKYL